MRKLAGAIVAIVLLACSLTAHAQGSRRLLSMGGAGLWTPRNITSLFAWWNAQDAGKIILNGSAVASWTDEKSGLVAAQATGSSQPAYTSNGIGTKFAITFNNINSQKLVVSSMILAQPFTIMTVAQNPTALGGNGGIVGNDASFVGIFANTSQQVFHDYGATPSGITIGSSVSLIESFANGAISQIGLNGTLSAPANAGTTGLTTSIDIGAWNSQYFKGVIGDIVIISAIPTTCQQQKLESFLAWKYGIQASLSSSNPYKTAPPLVGGPC